MLKLSLLSIKADKKFFIVRVMLLLVHHRHHDAKISHHGCQALLTLPVGALAFVHPARTELNLWLARTRFTSS